MKRRSSDENDSSSADSQPSDEEFSLSPTKKKNVVGFPSTHIHSMDSVESGMYDITDMYGIKTTDASSVNVKTLPGTEKYCDNNATTSAVSSMGEDPLRFFHVLDECEGSDAEGNPAVELDASSDSDISDEEVEMMLDKNLLSAKDNPNLQATKDVPYTERKIVRLEELGHNHFDVLPEGWVQINHRSGMPIYLHKPTRACTLGRPYYLGKGSAKKHDIPLSAIPCLQYRRALDEEKKAKESQPHTPDDQNVLNLHQAKIETAQENRISQSLTPFAVQQYCKQLFRFRTERKLHFESWADRRRWTKARKSEKQCQRPAFPDGTKLIKFPIINPDDGPGAKPRGEWILNPKGKSYICILHEYVQHALKKQPTYEFKALENPATPYSATVIIGDMKYGFGTGSSKKQAKLAAAKASLELLIPEMREKICNDNILNGGSSAIDQDEARRLSIFDEIKIEDPRVSEFCAKATEPLPYSILLTCLQRNYGQAEMNIDTKINSLNKQGNEFVMTIGKHTASVVCKSKKDGKQRASQKMLQALHPHISTWGSLLRLYGNKSIKTIKEKKQEEQEVTMLQSKASANSPNYAILNKLKEEMLKLHQSCKKVVPKGVFIPPVKVSLPVSGTELNKVDL